MATVFSRIINGELPAFKVAETDQFLAFLDIRPMQEGHTLCIPKKEIDYYFDLSDDDLRELTVFSKQVAKAIEAVIPCERIATAVLGLEVPHAHVHLVPVQTERDFGFGRSVEIEPDRMKEIAELISKAFSES
ncbi:MAG: HIT family protein [Bacteroidota bacterium]